MGRITHMALRRRQLTDNGENVLSDLVGKLRADAEMRRLEKSGDKNAEIERVLAAKRAKKK